MTEISRAQPHIAAQSTQQSEEAPAAQTPSGSAPGVGEEQFALANRCVKRVSQMGLDPRLCFSHGGALNHTNPLNALERT
ncbi:MAG: hypothetical protein AAFU77_03310 [Myxococcota bacterium]